jgi:hypothetical protein
MKTSSLTQRVEPLRALIAALRRRSPVAAILLAACSTPEPPKVEPNLYPTDFKGEIVRAFQLPQDTPSVVRNALISDPAINPADPASHYSVCVRFSTGNAVGRLTPNKDRIGYFYGGRLNQFVEATPEQCSKAFYKPFPELEKVCAGKGCG